MARQTGAQRVAAANAQIRATGGVSTQQASPRTSSGSTPRPIAPPPATSQGYWTEGRIVNGVNVGGGVFVAGTPPTPPQATTQVTPPSREIPPPPAGSAFLNSPAYLALSLELRELVNLGYSSFIGTPAQQRAFADALTQAQELADPYAKSQIGLFKAEYGTAIAKITSDFAAQKEILERTRTELVENLVSGKEFLSLEQQAEMARTLKGYDEDLLTIADQAAEKGITFATGERSRVLAEERRGTQFQDVTQSSRRRHNFQVKELELKAARGDESAKKQLASLEAGRGFDLERIGLAAERVLGSSGVPISEGFRPVGGALGSIEQERRKSIFDIASLGIST